MPVNERSIADILKDIVGNMQEIVRSEVRLAKSELRNEATKTKSAAVAMAIGAVMAVFALLFLLWTVVDALAMVLPQWAAPLIVSVTLAIIAVVAFSVGRSRFKQVHPAPERTIESVKENVEWLKHQAR
jgi:uncharacterized membrane protein YqjE